MPHRPIHSSSALGLARAALTLGALLGPGACLPEPPGPPSAAADAAPAAPYAVLATIVLSVDGSVWSPASIPRHPIFRILATAPLGGEPEPIWLIRGLTEAAIVDDLARAPTRQSTRAAALPLQITREGAETIAIPLVALEPGEPLWLAVAAWATDGSRTLGEVYLLPLEVAAGAAGASLVGSWPPDESAGVPADLPFAALHFDGEVTGVRAGIHLEGADGSEVPAEVGITDCAPIGFAAGRCALLRPLAELEPESRYRLRVSEQVVDTTGAAVGPRITRFSTARLPPATPTLLALPCALDEESVEGVCLLRDDRSVAIRAAASGPMRAFWSGAGQTIGAVAVRGEIELRLGELEPRTPLSLELRLVDLGGAERRLRIASGTRAPLAPIFITEVRADPSGPEPRQEYVEVVNSGPLPLSLEAFSITDDPLRAGDPLPASAPLPSGARALLVADAFEPDHPDDDLVPEGVPLIRVGRALGSGGLSAVGEPVLLRDAEGRRLSGAPARPSAGPGRCLVRTSEDGRRMDAQAFAWDAAGGCTPGLPDRTPERP